MRSETSNIWRRIDWLLILFYILFVGFGWLNIYAASAGEDAQSFLTFSNNHGKQLYWIIFCIPFIFITLLINAKFYVKYASAFYMASILSLIGLFLFGKNINGATSWYSIGSMGIQPSEFAKSAIALAMAKLVCDKHFKLGSFKHQLEAFILIAIPGILIALQPDPGSAIIYLSFILVLHREGLPISYLYISFFAITLFIATLYFGYTSLLISLIILFFFISIYIYKYKQKVFRQYLYKIIVLFLISISYTYSTQIIFDHVFEQRHRDRFNILLGKTIDVKDIGYNTNQSVRAIASGGDFGKGFLQGERTRGNFVPEQQTDYIFCTVGEEWGFAGTATVVVLFLFFILRILYKSERQKSPFTRIYGIGVASVFFFHFAINIGMVVGILPTIGIPLPFFSYGGSSLWGFTLLLFIFIRLDANKRNEL